MTALDTVTEFTQFVQTHRTWAAPIVLLLAFGESIAFASLVLPFWGMLVAIGAILGTSGDEFFLIWLAASIGAALGDWVSYWLGYHFHNEIARMWPLSKRPDLMPRAHQFFEKYGVWAIIIGRFSGPLRATVPIAAGAAEMDWKTFQIANWFSAFLWAFVLLQFGDVIHKTMSWLWTAVFPA